MLGNWLQRKRLDRGLTQSQLAKELGMSQAAISAYENGQNNIDSGRLRQLVTPLRLTDAERAELMELLLDVPVAPTAA